MFFFFELYDYGSFKPSKKPQDLESFIFAADDKGSANCEWYSLVEDGKSARLGTQRMTGDASSSRCWAACSAHVPSTGDILPQAEV